MPCLELPAICLAKRWPPIRLTALIRRPGNARIGGRGEIAQLVEHSTENRGVGGSSPPLATRKPCKWACLRSCEALKVCDDPRLSLARRDPLPTPSAPHGPRAPLRCRTRVADLNTIVADALHASVVNSCFPVTIPLATLGEVKLTSASAAGAASEPRLLFSVLAAGDILSRPTARLARSMSSG
jgi:hypothetical protein